MAPSVIVRTVHFNDTPSFETRPSDATIIEIIETFFGKPFPADPENLLCFYTMRLPLNGREYWCFKLRGTPTVNTVDERWIDISLDIDSFCGTRKDPFRLEISTGRQDPFTCAIADGIAAFAAEVLEGTVKVHIRERE